MWGRLPVRARQVALFSIEYSPNRSSYATHVKKFDNKSQKIRFCILAFKNPQALNLDPYFFGSYKPNIYI